MRSHQNCGDCPREFLLLDSFLDRGKKRGFSEVIPVKFQGGDELDALLSRSSNSRPDSHEDKT